MEKIEYSNRSGQITSEEIRAGLAETKRRMAIPGYAEKEKRRLANAEARGRSKGTKFPELAKRNGTKPTLTTAQREVADWSARLGL